MLSLAAERVRVGKRRVASGGVRVTKRVREESVVVDEPLARDEVVVARVPVGKVVDRAPAPRWVGDTLVVPVLEEELVVTRRLRVVEELHVRRRSVTFRSPRSVKVRREEAVVERRPVRDDVEPSRMGGSRE